MTATIAEALPLAASAPSVRPVMHAVPWALEEPRFRALLRELSFRYFKWDMYLGGTCRILPESIVLTREAHEKLVSMAEQFAALMRRFEAAVRDDPAIAAELGIDPMLLPLLSARSDKEPAFGRADFFLTPDGEWVLSEFNEDAPGGFNEAAGILELLGAAELGGMPAPGLRDALCGAFSTCEDIGFIFATAFSEDLQHCAVLETWLREAGHGTLRGAPDHLRARRSSVSLCGRPVQGLFRFYPGEWLPLLDNLDDWQRALPHLVLMNPPVRLLSQSKKSFGCWVRCGALNDGERALVVRHCPRTEAFRPGLLDRYREEREQLVLKRAFGRMGDAVVIGALTPAPEWDKVLAFAAARAGEFAVQQRFHVQPLAFQGGLMYPTIGVYTVNGRFAGYYSRVAPEPFITHEAFHVATVIEAA